MSAPAGYPLPWCDALNRPWWEINRERCHADRVWRDWQAPRPMTAIIPVLRWTMGLAA